MKKLLRIVALVVLVLVVLATPAMAQTTGDSTIDGIARSGGTLGGLAALFLVVERIVTAIKNRNEPTPTPTPNPSNPTTPATLDSILAAIAELTTQIKRILDPTSIEKLKNSNKVTLTPNEDGTFTITAK